MTLATSGGEGNTPMVFDTAKADCGDSDLGSPNMRCDGGGPGKGEGEPDGNGPNCVPLEHVLIVQEPGKDCPDDSGDGERWKLSLSPWLKMSRILACWISIMQLP